MSDTVLVTGAFGLVGSATVRALAAEGRRVVATDLDTDANRAKAQALPPGVQARWADLTVPADAQRLIGDIAPEAIIHLAAVIPPPIYRNPALARKVNVDATKTLVDAAAAAPNPPRFVQASSNAVYGSRNPYRNPDPVTAETPPRPTELYGGHKLESEAYVRASALDWVVLRLGGVMSTDLGAMPFSLDALYFESALPVDNRIHMVDVRDVATAFAAATVADAVGEILLIAGDDTHRMLQGDVGSSLAAARGLPGVLPPGRPGNPDSDDDWFITDWMDTTRAQEVLKFQHHSWPAMLDEIRTQTGWKRYPARLIAPLARAFVTRQGAYRNSPGTYADPWRVLSARLGDTRLDTAVS
ncbi:NAD(P)-dependent oxidoreductase [Mycolicibacterium fluoranthenivorans]|uniref:NAD(P)-dependent oxidoreductase n=1 Tax=Mycolicibacterium fluoranthenivorans TaxID=258505 RepID=A0A7G8PBV4_9MYCO|nr:NAD(P)-dependent oxidoreductase [Mycolicibacterium fluoranthenivorans]QNJ91820.1 NAD(P)-dependent oxidoreductase [Mycolicibacterium fluoranthenivorans]